MSRYVISVGGTGQHIALALTRLVRMGALRSDIRLIAIDPDSKTELTAALSSPGGMTGEQHPLKAKPVFAPFDDRPALVSSWPRRPRFCTRSPRDLHLLDGFPRPLDGTHDLAHPPRGVRPLASASRRRQSLNTNR